MEFFSYRFRHRDEDYEDPRRAFLVRALTLGLFAGGGMLWPFPAAAMAPRPRELPPGRSVFRVEGDVRVDGVAATRDTRIGPLDTIETGSGSELVFVVGKDAFMLRENSRVELTPLAPAGGGGGAGDDGAAASIIGSLRLLTGRILTVFGERTAQQSLYLHTSTATIGIRGTGVYLESAPDRSYVCTCYGATLLTATGDPASREAIESSHHDAPRFILADAPAGKHIEPAPVFHHTDSELVLLETLVGRKPPFWPLTTDY